MLSLLVTGVAGFIGFHVARRCLELGHQVIGIDNLNAYYDVQLKRDRLKQLEPFKEFQFKQMDLVDRASIGELFLKHPFDRVLHLAAQAGVRYSICVCRLEFSWHDDGA